MAIEMITESKNVLEYLSKNKFLIPMYQRPYAWGEEECEQLWNDVLYFFENSQESNEQDKYFLGSVVLYKNENGKQCIVDGQQRTTTLMLLIKALYDKSYGANNNKILLQNIQSCLWDYNKAQESVDTNAVHLESEVAIESDNEILKEILTNTYQKPNNTDMKKVIKESKSNYEKNYLFFTQKASEFLDSGNTGAWNEFCFTLLDNCYFLVIESKADSENTRIENALRIFNTLNNRGIPLSDSDIFKGEIFKSTSLDKRPLFASDWKELESKCDLNFIFRNYMHIIRARKNIKTNEIGLRSFFIKEHKDILQNSMEEIKELGRFWDGEYDEKYSLKSLQLYDVLFNTPNEYWKYLDSAYYMYCKDKGKDYFEPQTHEKFLARLITHFLVLFIDKPSMSVIKPIIYNAYTSLYEKGKIDFPAKTQEILANEENFKGQFYKANKLIPALLMLNLYLKYPKQEAGIPAEIEHIFPKTTNWRPSYTGWDKEEAKSYIESIGNKMWLEKKLNIKASNGYFDDKQENYAKSKFLEAQDLAKSPKNDWLKEDIEARNEEIYQRLKAFFEKNL